VKQLGKLAGPRFFPVSKARRNKLYIYRQCMYIVYILNMPSVSLDTHFYTVSLEKFEEFVNRRRIDKAIKEQTMIYKTLHRILKMEQHEP
jgi:hypothetical protein